VRLRARAEHLSAGARYEIAQAVEQPDGSVAIKYRDKALEAQPSSRAHDPLGDVCAALADAQGELDGLLKERHREKNAVYRIIAKLSESDRKLIRLRYVRGWSWERIQRATGFSAQTLRNRHSGIFRYL
jgi:DNA-directed RNA polymerase specialized sigma24 family protein